MPKRNRIPKAEVDALDLSTRERDTILAALRYWQREGWRSEGHEHDIASENGDPLDSSEINDLCERINQ